MPEMLDTNAKALRINLDPQPYGTFAEIGAGQEVSRWFFQVGGAAGTVAETVSAYDMTVSDARYGKADRYVSRERLGAMLDHEFSLLQRRLGGARGDKTAFFALANTVATRSHAGKNECHGWMGVRFQHAPGSPPSDIRMHVSLRDPTALQQQKALGVLGVNLLYGVYYQRENASEMLRALMDGLSLDRVEIDVLECEGPALGSLADSKRVATALLEHGLSNAVMFDDTGRMHHASGVIYKRGLLLHRASMERENPALDAMLVAGAAMLRAEFPAMERPPLPVLEVSLKHSKEEDAGKAADAFSARLGKIAREGRAVMATRWDETFHLTDYLMRYTREPVRFIVGVDMVVQLLRRRFYEQIDGGVLEGLGRVLGANVRIYAFSMPASVFRERLRLYGAEPDFCPVPDKPKVSLDDLQVAPPVGHLLRYMRESGWVIPAEF